MLGAVMVRFGLPKAGREPEALAFGMRGQAMFEEFRLQGLITGWRWIVNQTGDDPDVFMIEGDPVTLARIVARHDVALLIAEGRYLLEGFHVDMAVVGAGEEVWGTWGEMLEDRLAATAT